MGQRILGNPLKPQCLHMLAQEPVEETPLETEQRIGNATVHAQFVEEKAQCGNPNHRRAERVETRQTVTPFTT